MNNKPTFAGLPPSVLPALEYMGGTTGGPTVTKSIDTEVFRQMLTRFAHVPSGVAYRDIVRRVDGHTAAARDQAWNEGLNTGLAGFGNAPAPSAPAAPVTAWPLEHPKTNYTGDVVTVGELTVTRVPEAPRNGISKDDILATIRTAEGTGVQWLSPGERERLADAVLSLLDRREGV